MVADWLDRVGVATMVSKRVESLLNQLRTQGIVDERVLEAIALVPREKFVDEAFEHRRGKTRRCLSAGANHLATLHGGADDGASDADAGIAGAGDWHRFRLPDGDLAHLVHHVCSVERIKSLQWQARRRLKQLDLHNVSTRHGDGWQGWKARAL
jgi:protein-L-isoaspartate(D-aspartate) O-methyltransferase